MADSKGGFFTKTVQKHAGRAKEKILQNLGKADRTTDETFDEYLFNFNRQQNAANKLQRELNNYIRCARALQGASKGVYDAINELYEVEWSGKSQTSDQSMSIENLWQDFSTKLTDQVLIPLNTYQGQFPEVRTKIEKRDRKLLDYDRHRHSFQDLTAHQKRQAGHAEKVAKAKEQLEESKQRYEIINSELCEDLPLLYDSRIPFLVSNMQTFFSVEAVFHYEISKIHNDLESVLERLSKETQRGKYSTKKNSPGQTAINTTNSPSQKSPGKLYPSLSNKEKDLKHYEEIESQDNVRTMSQSNGEMGSPSKTIVNAAEKMDRDDYEPVELVGAATPNGSVSSNPATDLSSPLPAANNTTDHKKLEELYDIPVGATTENLPPGVLYQVRATYKYTKEDTDELAFEAGDIINVIEYEDVEEQEEGWLMGILESTGEKGLFPANFTRPI